jgi:hypothetical protein
MTNTTIQDELLKSAQFHPVFGENGDIAGISQLSVATDRRLGVRAVEELIEDSQKGDDVITQDGWTAKQHRILNSPAPTAFHYLKPSQKYDAATGNMVPKMTIILPFEVVWRLFELMFDGQYSIEIGSSETHSEDVLPIPQANNEKDKEDNGGNSDNAPGRIFYSRTEVTIVLHLKNGQTRRYTGVGVAYDHVRMNKSGNVFAINSARRTTEKGAVSDAKREAISNIGRVFRRAFEDGDEMIQKFEDLLVEKLRDANKTEKPARAAESKTVSAPKAREKTQTETEDTPSPSSASIAICSTGMASNEKSAETSAIRDTPLEAIVKVDEKNQIEDEIPFREFENEKATESENDKNFSAFYGGKVQVSTWSADDPDIFFDKTADLLSTIDDQEYIEKFLKENECNLRRAEKLSQAGNSYDALREMVLESLDPTVHQEQETTDQPQDNKTTTPEGCKLDVPKKTGAAILDAYNSAYKKARTPEDIDAILDANKDLAKRLTKGQAGKLLKSTMQAKEAIM